ncbi:archease [Flaviramulus sp. BrNp1-15]|uniref:archease n=1 Tax=Flaviramulus sp. BrNp1-15 TaxID=2916754 RepID=UPI001EE7D200|nr:archease [Flaviramulus sp. BrNp1-15]ULC58187.1 archease [Flaviramulus sp. BrNp1-15]
MKIKYLPHTADIRMLIEGETLQKLFMAGVQGMANILKEDICNHTDELKSKIRIKTSALDYTNLLIDFLSDVLSYTYTNKTIYCKIDVITLEKHNIIADVLGVEIEQLDEEIKAVTYHEAEVTKNKNNHWETCVIFDI